MNFNIQKILEAIKNNYQISFIYEQDKTDQFYREVQPYYIFDYKKKLYLVGFAKKLNTERFYNIQQISSIAIMPIYSTMPPKPFHQILKEQNAFVSRYCSLIDVYSKETIQRIEHLVNTKGPQTESKTQRLMEYYINVMKKEQLSELLINLEGDDFFHPLSGKECLDVVEQIECEHQLGSEFVNKYISWEKQLNEQPELSIYLVDRLHLVGQKF